MMPFPLDDDDTPELLWPRSRWPRGRSPTFAEMEEITNRKDIEALRELKEEREAAQSKLPMDMGSRDDRDTKRQVDTLREAANEYRAKKGLPPLP
jgi:hypothetical protein